MEGTRNPNIEATRRRGVGGDKGFGDFCVSGNVVVVAFDFVGDDGSCGGERVVGEGDNTLIAIGEMTCTSCRDSKWHISIVLLGSRVATYG